MDFSNQPELLFLRGTFADDLEDESVPEPLAFKLIERERVCRFNRFTNIETWPKTTTLGCWFCSNKFDTIPVAVPTHINQDSIDCQGVFCSFVCAKAWISRETPRSERWSSTESLRYLYQKMLKKKPPTVIQEAPPPTHQFYYGGHMSENDYREIICSAEENAEVDEPVDALTIRNWSNMQ